MNKKILIVNGPNLNLLGNREDSIYGKDTLDSIKKLCEEKGKSLDIEINFYQSNDEGEIITGDYGQINTQTNSYKMNSNDRNLIAHQQAINLHQQAHNQEQCLVDFDKEFYPNYFGLASLSKPEYLKCLHLH